MKKGIAVLSGASFATICALGILFLWASLTGQKTDFYSSHQDYAPARDFSSVPERYLQVLKMHLTRYDFGYSKRQTIGRGWPSTAETMISMQRMDNLHACIRDVIRRQVPGDLIECGVWRGGATIFMRAALEAYGDTSRRVWVADSFEGLPKPDPRLYPVDKGDRLWTHSELAVGLNQVKANFNRYGLLDQRVRFLHGWFKDTLPVAPIDKLAVLRVDADLYESTMQALEFLYPKLAIGDYCIIDDYGILAPCQKAVDDFRARRGIRDQILPIDSEGIYWRRTS